MALHRAPELVLTSRPRVPLNDPRPAADHEAAGGLLLDRKREHGAGQGECAAVRERRELAGRFISASKSARIVELLSVGLRA
jgi:hypothetical protein